MAIPDLLSASGRHRLHPGAKDTVRPGTANLTVITPAPEKRDPGDRAQAWLRGAMVALAVLAAAAAVVSWDAQYVLVRSVKPRVMAA